MVLLGYDPIWESLTDTTLLGRPAYQFRASRMVSLDDPAVMATDDVPHVLHAADTAEFVIDGERYVVLAWRGMFEERVYEQYTFTALRFDEPVDQALFDIDRDPLDWLTADWRARWTV